MAVIQAFIAASSKTVETTDTPAVVNYFGAAVEAFGLAYFFTFSAKGTGIVVESDLVKRLIGNQT